jgi:RNA polymerase sigma-70 factor (ECF subfamily)
MGSDAVYLSDSLANVDSKEGETAESRLDNDLVPTATADSKESDERLLIQAGEGSRAALTQLFRNHRRAVLNVASRILRDVSEAEDLCQDVFVYLFQKAKLFDPKKGSASSWIIQIAYHRAMNRRQYLAFRHHYESEELNEEQIPDKNDRLQVDEVFAKSLVERLRQELTPDQWKTMELHFSEGYSLREISEKTNQSLGNTRNHFYRGLERLRSFVFSQKGGRVRELERKGSRAWRPL